MKHDKELIDRLVKEKGIHKATAMTWVRKYGPEEALKRKPVHSMQARGRLSRKFSNWGLKFRLPGSPIK